MFINTSFDIPLLIIAILLIATLVAFFLGLFPYPYGLIILVALGFARISHIRHTKHSRR
jgi:hypothetical protein